VPFDIAAAEDNARRIHPGIEMVKLSCLTGAGLDHWQGWIEERRRTLLPMQAEAVT
jgi:hydrogenase nickel incorporation protein HypB